MTISKIRRALIQRYTDNGSTKAYVEWTDHKYQDGRTEGDPANPHMQALIARAKREGLTIGREIW